ncbi:hypothetical protein CONCODRAFT_3073 [Conidiobolus coronatus NRRL 28638]|uniref:Uncharacterized protein n=1 Tax=Conidiobolus coronatus (strain ATCC 28846 / CBS 209.66 / NRRL 28638) TaxID=796925 RepID=A0A137PG88_CONC2|nr:hypothetical protein CONCODRAFT_3073 [Conidiobolus coronatus NRRL 28638]|eukprot:KXN73998.1 hypothetical protein CONCODRAFT_3073 [Conidiobolus coronatus NRRL 28638]
MDLPFSKIRYISGQIWYPCIASENTYRQLCVTKVGIAKACLSAGYKNSIDEVGVDIGDSWLGTYEFYKPNGMVYSKDTDIGMQNLQINNQLSIRDLGPYIRIDDSTLLQ